MIGDTGDTKPPPSSAVVADCKMLVETIAKMAGRIDTSIERRRYKKKRNEFQINRREEKKKNAGSERESGIERRCKSRVSFQNAFVKSSVAVKFRDLSLRTGHA